MNKDRVNADALNICNRIQQEVNSLLEKDDEKRVSKLLDSIEEVVECYDSPKQDFWKTHADAAALLCVGTNGDERNALKRKMIAYMITLPEYEFLREEQQQWNMTGSDWDSLCLLALSTED